MQSKNDIGFYILLEHGIIEGPIKQSTPLHSNNLLFVNHQHSTQLFLPRHLQECIQGHQRSWSTLIENFAFKNKYKKPNIYKVANEQQMKLVFAKDCNQISKW